MARQKKYIWYASYGSNLLEERFLCYIRGGKPKGSTKVHKGCADNSLPKSNKEINIKHELYFARKSKSWDNGGVAFISERSEPHQRTLGRMYLITIEQFTDVLKQEIDFEGFLELDFEKAMKDGSLVYKKTKWYGKLLYLGYQNSFPIFTFTSEHDIIPTNKPGKSYLKTIISGIKEVYGHLTKKEIVAYLISKKGIDGNYSIEELKEIAEN